MAKLHYLGIDPGVSGAMTLLDTYGEIKIYNWEDKTTFLENMNAIKNKAYQNLVVLLEKVGGYVGEKQPGSAMFTFGENYGYIQGILWGLKIPFGTITPQQWQKIMHCGKHKTKMDHKRAMREQAQRLFPCTPISLRAADSVLLALAAKEMCKD